MGEYSGQQTNSATTLTGKKNKTEEKLKQLMQDELSGRVSSIKELIAVLESAYYFLELVEAKGKYKIVRLIKNDKEVGDTDEIYSAPITEIFPNKVLEIIEKNKSIGGASTICIDDEEDNKKLGAGCYNILWFTNKSLLIHHVQFASNESTLQALIESQKNLADLQENVPIGLFRLSDAGQFNYANPWTLKVLGLNPQKKYTTENLFEKFSDQKLAKQTLTSLKSGKNITDLELAFKNTQEEDVWCVLNISQAETSADVPFYSGYLYDISKRKAVVKQLQDNDGIIQSISQNLKSALYIFNAEGRFTFVNPAVSQITGYAEDELLSMKFYDLIHPDFKEIVKENGLNRVLGKKSPKNYEFKLLTKQGEERWMEIYGTRLFISNEWAVLGIGNDITNRKRVLDEIKVSEQKYKSLYSFFRLMADNTQDMIWAKDLKKRYIFANKALCDTLLLAHDTEEPVGKTDQFFAEREKAKMPGKEDWYTFGDENDDTDDIVMATQQPQQFDEYGNVKGNFLYMDVHKSPLFDDSGKMIGTVGSARNVTAAKRIEAEREKEEKIKNIVYRIGNAVSTTKDLSELITVIRLELNEVIDTTNMYVALFDKNTHEISLPYFVDEKDRFKRIPVGKSLTHYLIRRNTPILLKEKEVLSLAAKKEVELIGSLAKVWLGVPLIVKEDTIGALVVQNYKNENAFTERDLELLNFVSIQISISINQKKADDALRESEFTLRQIIDNVPVMICAKDHDLKILLANTAFASAYGMRVDQVEGRLQSDLHRVVSESDKIIDDDLEVIQSGKPKSIQEELFTDSKGKGHILQTVKIPMRPGYDQGIAVLTVSIDITERITFEHELKEAKNKAEEVDRLKTAFLANMSHEIRTPMNAIIGFSELLNDPDLAAPHRAEFVKLIGENSRVLLTLIEDIIDVAKIEAGQIKIVKGICEVNQVLKELKNKAVELIRKQPQKQLEVKLNCKVNDPGFAISTDPLRFKQVIKNLVGNAIKFTEKGYVEIGYYIEQNDQKIIFFVKDTGIGLEDDKLSLIFERFRQAEESTTKEHGGTGLGLTISRRLVEIMGGSMWVESILHEGSTFYFSLPYEAANVSATSKPLLRQYDTHDWSDLTILVAEDEASNFELISATLNKTKARLIRAVNGKDAVDKIEKDRSIDLVLMDIRMPVMNGHEATRRIRITFPELPIISLTAYAMSDDIQRSLDAGCNAHISKPFKPSELLKKLEVYIQEIQLKK